MYLVPFWLYGSAMVYLQYDILLNSHPCEGTSYAHPYCRPRPS